MSRSRDTDVTVVVDKKHRSERDAPHEHGPVATAKEQGEAADWHEEKAAR